MEFEYEYISRNAVPPLPPDSANRDAAPSLTDETGTVVSRVSSPSEEDAAPSVKDETVIRITNYTGDEEVVTIPPQIGGVPVRVLGSHAFYERGLEVERILLPDSVTEVEAYACEYCLALKELRLGRNVRKLGRAFLAVSQQNVLYIPPSVEEIEAPDELGAAIYVDPENPVYYSGEDVLYKRLPDGGVSLEMTQCCVENPGSDPEPEEEEENNKLRARFQIPEGVTRIAEHALDREVRLEEVSLPSTLREMAEGVLTGMNNPFTDGGIRRIRVARENPVYFLDDDSLVKKLPDGTLKLVRYLGQARELVLGKRFSEIASGAFFGSGICRIRIPDEVRTIRPGAFLECPLEEVYFPEQMIYFPAAHPWMQKNVLAGFGENGKRYDFTYYDQALKDPSLNAEKVRMIFTRLHDPVDLPEDTKREYRGRILGQIRKVAELFAQINDIQGIRILLELGFVTAENVDEIIEQLNQAKRQEMLYAVMEYKHENLETQDFDFSL